MDEFNLDDIDTLGIQGEARLACADYIEISYYF